ncbi:hypothetical protein V6N11_052286 [Hibiscus sabdariffa]|uniref:Endonuclease/exonuclease/phosphatase domain-containing protein n=1 Tax=Hibiscus sabdariffa TaxID=183260 RepID=A0ABR2U9K2_9ROSI
MSGVPTFLLENTRSTDIVNHGGWPLDIPIVPTAYPTRERDTSPSAPDDLWSAKKGRLSGSEQEESNTHAMEADDKMVHTVVNSDNLGDDLRPVDSDALRVTTLNESYASKVAESNLFGPWMLVVDKRRRGVGIWNVPPATPYVASGSRFAGLEVEESGGKEYNKKADKEATTDSARNNDKEPMQVVEHNVGFMRGEHMAVIINEHGRTGGSKGVRGDQRHRPIVGSGKIDVSRRHLQGAASTVFRYYFKEFVREHKPGIVALFKPRISGYGDDQVVKRLGFPHSFRVECHGFSGGMWLMWDDSVDIVILKISNQFIHFKVTVVAGNMSFLMTAVYASPCSSKRKFLWPHLATLNPDNNVPWLIGGDFNVILSGDERTGGANVHSCGSRLFSDFLFTRGMNDMGFYGPPFTWSRGSLSQRLDRCVVNSMWYASFVTSYVVHLDRLGSNHRPLLGSLGDVGYTTCNMPFRFIEAWQTHPQFKKFLCHKWSPEASWSDNVAKFHSEVEIWTKKVFGHLGNKKRRLRARLRGIDWALMTKHSDYLSELTVVLRSELEVVMTQEESFWRQKDCSRWVLQGDRNTKFFHTPVMTRRQVNRISALQEDDGSWCTEDADLKELALNFYGELFSSLPAPRPIYGTCGVFPSLVECNSGFFDAPVTLDEIRQTVFSMGATKAPGSDGLNVGFFQHN